VAQRAPLRPFGGVREGLRDDDCAPPVLDELGFHTPDTAAEVSVEAELAAQVLQTLRPEQRKVIELGLLHGLSHSEIAEATGMPLGTVKTFMRRGLIQVREKLGVSVGEAQ